MTYFRKVIKEVFFVSRITQVGNKKLRIILSVILSNLQTLADILIILFFANLLVGDATEIEIINRIIENIYLLPILILLRFLISFIQTTNIVNLQLNVEKI